MTACPATRRPSTRSRPSPGGPAPTSPTSSTSSPNGGDRTRADPADVDQVLRSLINRVRNAPALLWDRKAGLQDTLTVMLTDPPDRSNAQVDAWRHLVRHHPQEIRTLDRAPVALPVMDEPQEAAWHALDFDRDLDEAWVLVGGQMTMIHCLEHGVDGYRATDEGDIVLGVWTRRDALSTAARLLLDRDFAAVDTSDATASPACRRCDLLMPPRQTDPARQARLAGGLDGNELVTSVQRLRLIGVAIVDGVRTGTGLEDLVPVLAAGLGPVHAAVGVPERLLGVVTRAGEGHADARRDDVLGAVELDRYGESLLDPTGDGGGLPARGRADAEPSGATHPRTSDLS